MPLKINSYVISVIFLSSALQRCAVGAAWREMGMLLLCGWWRDRPMRAKSNNIVKTAIKRARTRKHQDTE